jgi:RND family efflux transporter MFP subunit
MKLKMRSIYNPLIIILSISLISTYCSQNSGSGNTNPESQVLATEISNNLKPEVVEVMKLKKQQIEHSIEYTSNLTAFEEIHLSTSSPAKIEKIYVEIGDKVKKGELLVQMDRTRLHQAIIQLKTLETNLSRLDTLIKTNTISQQQYDQVKTEYDLAKSNVEFLEENTRLRAPFNGTITGKYYEDGEFYSGTPNTQAGKAAIISIMQINPLKAIVDVSEQYFPDIHKSLKADVFCDIYPGEVFKGRVYRVHPVIDEMSRTFQVEVSIPNKGEKLRPGMYARVDIYLGKTEALVVPAIAVLKMQGSNVKYVFLNNQGKARMVEVTIGKRYDDQLQVISDELHEGDELVITGQSKLVDEVPIQIVNNI